MVKSDLAIFGGRKAIETKLASYNPIGQDELAAASEVIESGVLSKFLDHGMKIFTVGQKQELLKIR